MTNISIIFMTKGEWSRGGRIEQMEGEKEDDKKEINMIIQKIYYVTIIYKYF